MMNSLIQRHHFANKAVKLLQPRKSS